MAKLPRNVWILAICSAFFMSVAVFMVFVGGILGNELTNTKSLSTLPVAAIVVGTAASILPVVRLMSVFGRKRVFLSVCLYTIATIGLGIYAINTESFLLFCLSSFLLGATAATMYQFRFAAIESVQEEQRATAIAIVLLGSLLSAYIGPEVATLGKNWFAVDFIGSFVLLALLFVPAFVLFCFFQPVEKFHEQVNKSRRSLIEIIQQGSFIVAASAATTGYVVMSFVMTATPVSMHVMDGFSLEQTKFVIQSHVIAMFLPSLFTAMIVKYLGVSRMMILGVIILFVSVTIAYLNQSLNNYWWSLMFLGLGWNFLFIGGTNLLPRSYNENEKFKVQSVNDFLVFGFQAFAALSAGWFVFNFSWEVTLLSVIPILIIQLLLLIWWLKNEKRAR
ncbi:MAG: MFS transporter [Candidatus Thioglobus sp.]|jgi:MFS family permease|nr:MFS transporter [Candidatus Thioglobus sp.]